MPHIVLKIYLTEKYIVLIKGIHFLNWIINLFCKSAKLQAHIGQKGKTKYSDWIRLNLNSNSVFILRPHFNSAHVRNASYTCRSLIVSSPALVRSIQYSRRRKFGALLNFGLIVKPLLFVLPEHLLHKLDFKFRSIKYCLSPLFCIVKKE